MAAACHDVESDGGMNPVGTPSSAASFAPSNECHRPGDVGWCRTDPPPDAGGFPASASVEKLLRPPRDGDAQGARPPFGRLFREALGVLGRSAALPAALHAAVLLGLLPLWRCSREAQYCVAALSCAMALGAVGALAASAWRMARVLEQAAASLGPDFGGYENKAPLGCPSFGLFIQHAARPACFGPGSEGVQEADPLDQVREEIRKHSTSSDGFAVIQRAGTILWCNAALERQFGYSVGELMGRNVRILMPPPYCTQHDGYLQRYKHGHPSHVIGCSRRVPVQLKDGTPGTAMLEVQPRWNDADPESSVFIGSLSFRLAASVDDPAAHIQRAVQSNPQDISRCFASLDSHPDCLVVINSTGIIRYVNDSATMLLNYGFGELLGQNVSCLMMDEHAKGHDAILNRYQEKAVKAMEQGTAPESTVVGRSRDFYAKSKDGRLLRVFLSVKRVDCSSFPADCLFVGTLLLVQQAKAPGGHVANSAASCAASTQPSSGLSAHSREDAKLSRLSCRKSTIVAVDVRWAGPVVGADYQALLNLLTTLCIRHKATLQAPLAYRLFLTFNAELTNPAHRNSAGALMDQLMAHWKATKSSSSLKLRISAASGDLVLGWFGKRPVMITQLFDTCTVLLSIAADAAIQRSVIDAALFEELQYAFSCRVINALTVRCDVERNEHTQFIYELLEIKQLEEDEWMYQLIQQTRDDPLCHWRQCWASLGQPVPVHDEALSHLQAHLELHPTDLTAQWLTAVVRRLAEGRPRPPRAVWAADQTLTVRYCGG